MPTDPTPHPSPNTRDSDHAHATDADLTGPKRDSEKDVNTPQPGDGFKQDDAKAQDQPAAELGHS